MIWIIFAVSALILFVLLQRGNSKHNASMTAPYTGDPDERTAKALVDIGLAEIGKKTQGNPFSNPKKATYLKKYIEGPFFEMLYEKFQDTERREILVKHFSEFKEMCLFEIFGMLLPDLYVSEKIRKVIYNTLCEKLSEGLTPSEQDEKNEYQALLTKHLNDAFESSQKIQEAVKEAFWGTIIEKYPQLFTLNDSLGLVMNRYLSEFFRVTYETLEQMCKKMGVIQ